MPRRRRDPAPFWWAARQSYYPQVGKKQIKLSPDLDEAKTLAHKILSEVPATESRSLSRGKDEPPVAGICDGFLEW